MHIKQEYPKYIQLENGYVIVENKEEELTYLKEEEELTYLKEEEELTYLKEEENEPTSKNHSKGVDKKKSNANRGTGGGGESKQ